ncbi:MAG: hypothetical protein JRD89_00410 [Deltaproteobacteria bacterium]|nr:hypothetical protein [Deltaproteobacteria bacterium]
MSEKLYELACQQAGPEFAELVQDIAIAVLDEMAADEHDPEWQKAFSINRALNWLKAKRAVEKLAAAWKQAES